MPIRPPSSRSLHAALAAGLGAFAMAALECDDPQAPAPAPAPMAIPNPPPPIIYQGRFETGDLRWEPGPGVQMPFRLVTTSTVVDAANHRVRASVGIRNTGTQAVAGPRYIVVSDFVPADVTVADPAGADCPVDGRTDGGSASAASCYLFLDHHG